MQQSHHSTYDIPYLAFAIAIAIGARGVVVADGPFIRAIAGVSDPALTALLIALGDWQPTGRSLENSPG